MIRRMLRQGRRSAAVAIAVPLIVMLVPAWASAQGHAPTSAEAQALSQDLLKTLMGIRVLGLPQPVMEVVQVIKVDGGSTMVPVTATLGMSDLRSYEDQLESVFPTS